MGAELGATARLVLLIAVGLLALAVLAAIPSALRGMIRRRRLARVASGGPRNGHPMARGQDSTGSVDRRKGQAGVRYGPFGVGSRTAGGPRPAPALNFRLNFRLNFWLRFAPRAIAPLRLVS